MPFRRHTPCTCLIPLTVIICAIFSQLLYFVRTLSHFVIEIIIAFTFPLHGALVSSWFRTAAIVEPIFSDRPVSVKQQVADNAKSNDFCCEDRQGTLQKVFS